MKPRKSEALRLETDYLNRVRGSLRGQLASDVEEIIESLQVHIEEEVSLEPGGEVTLVQMANVLERLGPPEAYAQEEEVAVPKRPEPRKPGPPEIPSLSGAEKERFADLLDKIWLAYLVCIAGLFIPIIDLHICGIIGAILLAVVLLRLPRGKEDELRSAGSFALADAILLLLVSVGSLLTLVHQGFALLNFPVVLIESFCSLVCLWKIMGKTASFMTKAGFEDIAAKVYSGRISYIIFYLILLGVALFVATVIAVVFRIKNPVELWWVGIALLPVGWIFGYLFILKPLGASRDALRGRVA